MQDILEKRMKEKIKIVTLFSEKGEEIKDIEK